MEASFWEERWRANQIGFHQQSANALLRAHWRDLGAPADAAAFVPLCGKSLDMRWLAQQGHPVRGVELSSIAVEAFFRELGETPARSARGELVRYAGRAATIWQGDFFALRADELGRLGDIVAAYDRGALVALPPKMRREYAAHLLALLPSGAKLLLITVEYDQARVSGPPFSVSPDEVRALFAKQCEVARLGSDASADVPPRFLEQGVRQFDESAWRIVKAR